MIHRMPDMKRMLLATFCTLGVVAPTDAQTARDYPKAQGGTITLPAGAISFADRVVRFDEGDPPSKRDDARHPEAVLGPPDRDAAGEAAALTLGCRGAIILEFADNALIDVAGPDLHVWEVGDDVEPTELAISRTGRDWVEIGSISGGTASLDISDKIGTSASYRYVRLTDRDCQSRGGRWPGADIDAVAAVGTAERIVLDNSVLFGFDEAVLSAQARDALDDLASRIAATAVSRLEIEGHTDSQGSSAYNRDLSAQRAEAVRAYLGTRDALQDVTLEIRAVGEAEPIASNDTQQGRRTNRRVEIIAFP